jgi:PAS domain S-box-containing protein
MNRYSEKDDRGLSDLPQPTNQPEAEKNDLLNDLNAAKLALDKLQMFADLSPDSLLFLDKSTLIIDCNTAAVSQFGCDGKTDLIGKSFYELMPPKAKDAVQHKIEGNLQNNLGCKVETTFRKSNGHEFAAILSLSAKFDTNNVAAAIVQDISHVRKIQADANKQIEVLAKLSIFNYEIKQAQTCSELKQSLCNQCVVLTEANEAWILSNVSETQTELVCCNNQLNTTQYADVDKNFAPEALKFLSTPQDVYIFEHKNIINPPGLKHHNPIAIQYVIGTKLRSGNWTLLGLNYDSVAKAKNEGDLEFLRNIFSQVFTTLENLSTYEKLIENETKFRTIIEKSDNVICILSKELVYTYISPAINNYQYQPSDMVGKRPGDFTHPDDKHLYLEAVHKVFLNKTETVSIPSIRNLRKDGSITYSSVDITNMMHIKGVEGLVINLRDINQQINYEIKLRQSEEKFRNIFNSGNDPVYITDLRGNFLEINDVAVTRTGFSKTEFLSTNLQNFSSEIPHERALSFIAEIIKDGSANTEESYIDKEGNKVYFQVTGKLIDYNNGKALLLRTINISDRKKIERQILDTIINTEENERARFARELHDGIGPYLSAIKFFLQTLSRENDVDTRNSITHKALESIDEIIRNIKEISNNISPRVLNHFGIIPAINTLVKKVSDSHVAITINSNIEGIRFSENMEINIFRIYTELINNSLKHSKATHLTISLTKDDNNLIAIYSDNGIGFDFNKKYALGKGSGLYNIANRVNSLYGKYEFMTAINNGLKFKATFEIK